MASDQPDVFHIVSYDNYRGVNICKHGTSAGLIFTLCVPRRRRMLVGLVLTWRAARNFRVRGFAAAAVVRRWGCDL